MRAVSKSLHDACGGLFAWRSSGQASCWRIKRCMETDDCLCLAPMFYTILWSARCQSDFPGDRIRHLLSLKSYRDVLIQNFDDVPIWWEIFRRIYRGWVCVDPPVENLVEFIPMLLDAGVKPCVDGFCILNKLIGGRYNIPEMVPVVRRLLELGCDPNASRGCEANSGPALLTLLFDAYATTEPTTIDFVRLLLEFDADPNTKNYYDETALDAAVESDCSIEVVRTLIDHGASILCKDRNGRTPLELALEYERPEEIIQMLTPAHE